MIFLIKFYDSFFILSVHELKINVLYIIVKSRLTFV